MIPESSRPLEVSGDPPRRRITVGLNKIALALRHGAWQGATAHGLTPTQGQILAMLRNRPDGMRLSAIADALGVTRASASDAVSALTRKRLVAKHAVAGDGRGRLIALTQSGHRAAGLVLTWPDLVHEAVDTLGDEEQAALLRTLVKLIRALQERGQISPSRMCVTCSFFRPHVHPDPVRPHHCAFVDAAFGDRDLRLDCPDHVVAADAARMWEAFARRAS